ncbi:MAG: glycosyltransferase family 39 protein [Bacteroidota bacterium]
MEKPGKHLTRVRNTSLKGQKKRESPRRSRKPGQYIYPLSVFVFALILYGNTLSHSYALDDDIVSRKNVFVSQGFKGIPMIFAKGFLYGFNQHNDQSYRPVSLFTMAAEVGIWGENPQTHHFFNVFYYALACMLLFFVVRRMFQQYPAIIPLIIVLLFTAHPVHTEAVANFKSRDEVLNLLFLMGLMLSLFRFTDTNQKRYLVAGMVCFFMALLTKEQAITFLALVPLAMWFFTGTGWKRILVVMIPFVCVAFIYALIRWAVLDVVTFAEKITIVNNALAAATSSADRFATAMLIMGRYVLLLIFPHPLSYDYSFNQIPIVSLANPWVIATILAFTAGGVYAVARFRAKDVHSFGFFFFIITMLVVSNIFIMIGSTLGERFLLIPSIAFCLSLVFLAARVTQTDLHTVTLKKLTVFTGILGAILFLYSLKTITRNADWKDNLTLFEADISASPNSTRAQASLGYTYLTLSQSSEDNATKQAWYDKSKACFEKSLEIYPGNTYALKNYGYLEIRSGKITEADGLYLKAFRLEPQDQEVLNNLSAIAIQREQYDSAIVFMTKLTAMNPGNASLLSDLGVVFQRKGMFDRAVEYQKKSLAVDPSRAATYSNLVQAYAGQGDTASARYWEKQRATNAR